jgi:hypothetical protein
MSTISSTRLDVLAAAAEQHAQKGDVFQIGTPLDVLFYRADERPGGMVSRSWTAT